MTISSGTRIYKGATGITRWSADTDAMTRVQFDDSHYVIDEVAAKFDQGTSRPTAGLDWKGGFYFHTTDLVLSYCNGTNWYNISLQGQTISSSLVLGEAVNIQVGTATGTKIGTATNQKLGFYNATPVTQPANTVNTRAALVNLGLVASGGDTRFDFISGANSARPTSPDIGQHYYNTTQKKLEYYTGSGWVGVVPTGTIAPFYGTTAPNGWLFCDGTAIGSDFTDLIALVGANLPDLRSKTVTGRASTSSTYTTGGDATLDASIDLVLVPTATSYTPQVGDVIGTLIDDNTDLTKVPPTGYINWIIKT